MAKQLKVGSTFTQGGILYKIYRARTDKQSGKKKYKKRPPYIPTPENKSEMCGNACKVGVLVAGGTAVAGWQAL